MTKKKTPTRRSSKTIRAAGRLSDDDVYLFREGTHYRLWELLGAHPGSHAGKSGAHFSIWAPAATFTAGQVTVPAFSLPESLAEAAT